MTSTYSANSGIEKPAAGDQSGTWGDTVNTNMDIIDRVMNGVGSISLSGTTHTLTTTDGTVSEGHYKILVLGGSPSGTNTITVTPNDQDKLFFVVNASGQAATFSQGSGANVTVDNGKTKIIYCDGAGAGAAVSDFTKDFDLAGTTEVVTLNIGGTDVTSTAAELNILDGVTSTAAELNLVDGSSAGTIVNSKAVVYGSSGEVNATTLQVAGTSITSTPAEINLLDGSVAGTVVNSKGVIYGSSGEVNATTLQIGGSSITSTAAELNLIDGSSAGTIVNSKAVIYGSSGEVNATTLQVGGTAITSTPAELNLLDGSSAGTVANSKAVIYGSSGEVNATTLQVGGTSITSTPAELNLLDGSSAGTIVNSKGVIYGSSGEVNATTLQIGGTSITATAAELNYVDGVTSAIQTQIDAKQATITGAASTITSSNLTASRALESNGSGKVAASSVTSTELGYVSGVTSAIQTQIDAKQATITGAATTITGSDLTASRALSSNSSGKVEASSVTSTELGYLSGVTSNVQTQFNNIVTTPAGVVSAFAGSSAPSGWLLCYGQAVSRTTYSALFSAISTTYGTGDGSTTFNLPDLRGRAVAGQDDMGGSSADRLTGQSGGVDGDTLGATGGGETHTLTTSQIPAHTHTFQSDSGGKVSFAGLFEFLADNTPTNRTSSSTGGGAAHNNVQPTLILNYIIKT